MDLLGKPLLCSREPSTWLLGEVGWWLVGEDEGKHQTSEQVVMEWQIEAAVEE